MPDFPLYLRNRITSVEVLDDTTLLSTCRLTDTLTEAVVELRVQLPDLEVVGASGRFIRSEQEACGDIRAALQKMIGVRIGSGLLKIIQGLISEASACELLPYMVEEACQAVILSFTKDTLTAAPKDQDLGPEIFREMVKANIRLYNRCAAFAPGSSIVEGIEPPK